MVEVPKRALEEGLTACVRERRLCEIIVFGYNILAHFFSKLIQDSITMLFNFLFPDCSNMFSSLNVIVRYHKTI